MNFPKCFFISLSRKFYKERPIVLQIHHSYIFGLVNVIVATLNMFLEF